MNRWIRAGFLALIIVLAATFVALPPQAAFPLYTNPLTVLYVQTSMMQNAVPLSDSPNVVAALEWLNAQHFNESVLLAHTSFVGWAKLYSTLPEIYDYGNSIQVELSDLSAYEHTFVLYWAQNEGWFEPSQLPNGVVAIYTSGRITVYELVISSSSDFKSTVSI